MDKRILVGCIAALATMLGVDLLMQASGWNLDLPLRTPLGTILIGNLVVTFAAMTLGGWIARHRFRWIAVALCALVWVSTIFVIMTITPPTGASAAMSLSAVIKYHAIAILLGLAAAWLGAMLGERVAARLRSPVSA